MEEKKLLTLKKAKKAYFAAQCSLNVMESQGYALSFIKDIPVSEDTLYSWSEEYIEKDRRFLKKLPPWQQGKRLEGFISLTYLRFRKKEELAGKLFTLIKDNDFNSDLFPYYLESLCVKTNQKEYYGLIPEYYEKMDKNNLDSLIDNAFVFFEKAPLKTSSYFYMLEDFITKFSPGYKMKFEEMKSKMPWIDSFRYEEKIIPLCEVIEKTSSLDIAMNYYKQLHDVIHYCQQSIVSTYAIAKLILCRDESFSYNGLLLDNADYHKENEVNLLSDDYIKLCSYDIQQYSPLLMELLIFDAIYKCGLRKKIEAAIPEEAFQKIKKQYAEEDNFFYEAFFYLIGFTEEKDIQKAYSILRKEEKKSESIFSDQKDGYDILFRNKVSPFMRRYIPLYIKVFDEIQKED